MLNRCETKPIHSLPHSPKPCNPKQYSSSLMTSSFSVQSGIVRFIPSHSQSLDLCKKESKLPTVTISTPSIPLESLTPSSRNDMYMSCITCKITYESKQAYANHVLIHEKKKPFVCTQCHATFRQSGHLASHQRIHTGEKPYTCREEGCPLRFKDGSGAMAHYRRAHNKDYPKNPSKRFKTTCIETKTILARPIKQEEKKFISNKNNTSNIHTTFQSNEKEEHETDLTIDEIKIKEIPIGSLQGIQEPNFIDALDLEDIEDSSSESVRIDFPCLAPSRNTFSTTSSPSCTILQAMKMMPVFEFEDRPITRRESLEM